VTVVKAKKNPPHHSAKSSKRVKSGSKGAATAPIAPDPRFVSDLVTRGDAAEPTADGKLPLEATYAVTERNPDGTVKSVRAVRKKLF